MITVLVVEDHAVVRHGLRFLLEQEDDFTVIAEAVNGSDALAAARAHQPDVVLLDLFIPPPDGLTILPVLRTEHPSTAIVVLTSSGNDEHVIAAIRSGALSYLHKTAAADEITAAVRAAAAGQGILTPATASLLQHRRTMPTPRLDLLSPREREILAELSRGRSNREISRVLSISEDTVKTHISRVLSKLGAADRTQAAIIGLQHKLVPLDTALDRPSPRQGQ
jgi:NarL family two-component system response regulator LiaR